MKIVDIFVPQLYSFVYTDANGVYQENEYDRLINQWIDVNYLRNYAKINKVAKINQFVKDRLRDAECIEDLLDELTHTDQPLTHYFRPLHDQETRPKILSLQKGKASLKDGLRLYAIKIDDDCFVITGGAIKMSQAMQDHPDSKAELAKIKTAQYFLQQNGIIDEDSFYEFKKEME